MKSKNRWSRRGLPILLGSMSLAVTLPSHADLVAQWEGDTFTPGSPWVSTVGSISATPVGSPGKIDDFPLFNNHDAINLTGTNYFTVPQASNPLNGATQLTLVAVFVPSGPGTTGGGFAQGSGLIGMEINGDVADWGLAWNGDRLVGGAGAPDRPLFSPPRTPGKLQIAVFTWTSAGTKKLFINGTQVATNVLASTVPRLSGPFALGAITATGGNPLNGNIAELRMYNSDESANVATITNELRAKYASSVLFQSIRLTSANTGEIRIQESPAAPINTSGDFFLSTAGADLFGSDLVVTREGSTVVVKFTTPLASNMAYNYNLEVPLVGGDIAFVDGSYNSFKVPFTLAGPAGSNGTWGIREYVVANTADIASAAATATNPTPPTFVDGTAPVFNHYDPETNGVRSIGNFNNDLPLVSNTAADDAFVVVGKTKISVPAPGNYTFSVHSDDGFAMRVTGPGGGRFITAAGDGTIDPVDPTTVFRDGGTGDSNTRGVYMFDAAGEYDITYLGYDGAAGSYYEVAWTPGSFAEDRATNTWSLVGTPSSPLVPPYRQRFATAAAGPSGTAGKFGVRTYLQAQNGADLVGNAAQMTTFLNTTTRSSTDANGLTVDSQQPYLNHYDPQNSSDGIIPGALPFPGNTPADDNNVVTVAKGRINIQSAGTYTFHVQSDDDFMLRLKGANGLPDPSFKKATGPGGGRFEMSHTNELFYENGASTVRGIIDLQAGAYDVELQTVENGGGFGYELSAAPGSWPDATTPPQGFKLVGFTPPASIAIPGIADPGWKVESSVASPDSNNPFGFSIAGAEARINATLAMTPPPANSTSFWDVLDFNDPEDGPQGSFTPTNPWPLNTPNPDNNYAMRATGILNITVPGTYHLGFQGDDGGYMYIYGEGGNPNPVIDSIVFTRLPNAATIGQAPGSSVNNAVRAEAGTGNSRTVVAVNLAAGQYRIQTLVYEGGGGSWWEVFGGQAADPFYNYPLLRRGPGSSLVITPGIPLIEQGTTVPSDIRISGFMVSGNPVSGASFSFNSQAGKTYAVQASTNLVNWTDLIPNLASGGATTNVNINLNDYPAFAGQKKVFFRVVDRP